MDKTDYEAKLATEIEKLRAYQKSLEQEHKAIISESTDGEPLLDAEAIARATNQKMLKLVDKAVTVVEHILEYGDKDSTRFAVARYVLDRTKVEDVDKPKDPWDDLRDRIMREDAKSESET